MVAFLSLCSILILEILLVLPFVFLDSRCSSGINTCEGRMRSRVVQKRRRIVMCCGDASVNPVGSSGKGHVIGGPVLGSMTGPLCPITLHCWMWLPWEKHDSSVLLSVAEADPADADSWRLSADHSPASGQVLP